MRERVLALLSTSLHPLTAYEIADRLSQTKKVQAVQVYRALDFLQEVGCIHRLTARSSYFACDHKHAQGETVVFMLCSQCGVVQEAASDVVGRGLRSAAKSSGFTPDHRDRGEVREVFGKRSEAPKLDTGALDILIRNGAFSVETVPNLTHE